VVVCLKRGADLHTAQLMPLPLALASVKSRLVLPFWLGGAIVRVQLPAVPFSGNSFGQVVHTRVCVIKQYYLVLVEGR